MSTDSQQDRLDALADEFSARLRAGEHPSVTEYAERFPDDAAEIEEFLTSVAMMNVA